MANDKYFTYSRRDAAAFLTERGFPIAPATLARLATRRSGPQFQLWNGRALYRPAELLRWARSYGNARNAKLDTQPQFQRLPSQGSALPSTSVGE